MKFKKIDKESIVIIALVILLGAIGYFYFSPSKLEQICKPDPNFKNIYDMTDREFLAFSLSESVHRNIQYHPDDIFFFLVNVLKDKRGNCLGVANVLKSCLDMYGFEAEVVIEDFPFDLTHDVHAFVVVTIEGKKHVLDSTLGSWERSGLFGRTYFFTYWDWIYHLQIKEALENESRI